MDIWLIVEWLVKSLFLVIFLLTGFAYTTWYERRFLAKMQVRYGPNRAGPMGLLQPVADGVKLIFKEEFVPASAYKVLYMLAPIITVIPAFMVMAVVPWGTSVELFNREIPLGLANINVGVLYILSVTSIAIYGIVLGGWASNNKYAMMGGLRASAQMVSYELAMGLALVGPMMIAGSMSLVEITAAQKPVWFVVYQPIAFIIFAIAALAELNRAPFDMPEAEQELVAGYHAEYSGMKFALFFMAEYIKMIAMSAIGATLFFGGYRGIGVDTYPWLGPLYLFGKILIGLGLMIWIRATFPRIRYDRLMAFGWKILLPLALLNVFITAIVLVALGG